MADLAKMKAAAAQQGASAPADYPGGPDKWVQDWYQNAVDAGSVQDSSVQKRGQAVATDENTGNFGGQKNTGSSAFADMIRKKAKDEHWSEDFERFSDAQLEAWKNYYDPASGKFKNKYGDIVEKPDERGPNTPAGFNGTGDRGGWDLPGGNPGGDGGGGNAGGPGQAAAPAAPTTHGNQLSYTGNPLTDMLLYQFNTGTQLSDPSKMNTFAMGEDRAEGGTDANADQQKRTGQLLKGGGLWWGNSEDTFGGFSADKQNANAANANPAAPQPPQPTPSTTPAGSLSAGKQEGAANQFATPMSASPGGISIPPPPNMQSASMSPMSSMMTNTWRQAAGGTESPFEKRAF